MSSHNAAQTFATTQLSLEALAAGHEIIEAYVTGDDMDYKLHNYQVEYYITNGLPRQIWKTADVTPAMLHAADELGVKRCGKDRKWRDVGEFVGESMLCGKCCALGRKWNAKRAAKRGAVREREAGVEGVVEGVKRSDIGEGADGVVAGGEAEETVEVEETVEEEEEEVAVEGEDEK